MATWIAHLRVAENLLQQQKSLDLNSFLVGSIAPDSGVPNEDWSEFTPPKETSHWYNDAGEIDAESFRIRYLNSGINYTEEVKAFYVGYYVHLLCDMEWGQLVKKKLPDPLYGENLKKDPKFIWVIKEDWYGQDHLYLKNNKASIFFRRFIDIKEFPNVYLDIYPFEAFTRQVNYISEYYLGFKESLDRSFIYLSKEEMDDYVNMASIRITELLHKHELI